VLLDVLEQLLEEPLFDALRTQQQLGYSVSCGARWTAGVCGFGVRVLRYYMHQRGEKGAVRRKEDRVAQEIHQGFSLKELFCFVLLTLPLVQSMFVSLSFDSLQC